MAEVNKNDLISPNALKVLDDLNKTLITIDDSFRDIAKTVKGVQSTLAKGTGIKKQRQETNKLVNAEKKLKFATSEAGRELEVLKQKTAKVNKENRKLAKSALGVKKSFGLIKNLLGAAGIVGGFQTLVSVMKAGLKIIKDYTTANSTLRGILNKTKKETEDLRKQQKRLGSTTAFSATQVTKAQTELARLGLTMGQIKALTPDILNAAVAMGVDMADAAGLVASQLNAFGLSATEGGRVADVLTKATQISAFNFEKLKTSLSVVSPAAKAVGATIEETTAILSAAVDANIDAGTAATGLRNIFIDLEEKGISWEDAMAKINGSTNKLSAANALFGKRGAVVASVIADSTDKIKANTKALNNARLTSKAFADEQLDNLEGDMILLTSAWEGFVLSIESGEGVIAKTLRAITQSFTAWFTVMSNIDLAIKSLFTDLKDLSDEEISTTFDISVAPGTTIALRDIADRAAALAPAFVDMSKESIASLAVISGALQEMGVDMEDSVVFARAWFREQREAAEGVEDVMVETKKAVEGVTTAYKMMVPELRKSIQQQIAELRVLTNHFLGFGENLEKELADQAHDAGVERMLARGEEINAEIELEKDRIKRIKKLREKAAQENKDAAIDLAIQTAEGLSNLRLESIAIEQEQNQSQREEELTRNDEATARALLAAEGDEEEKRRIQEASKLREAQINLKADRENARLRQKQARAEKQNALFEIAIKTAIAIAAANAIGPPQNVPAMIFAAAAGAVQALIVAARPVPAFFKGIKNAPKEGTFGEKGRELVTTKGGKSFLTPDSTTYFNDKMMEGATITPHKETEEILGSLDDARLQRARVSLPKKVQNNSFERLEKQQIKNNQILNKILNRPIHVQHISKDGFTTQTINVMDNVKKWEDMGFKDYRR